MKKVFFIAALLIAALVVPQQTMAQTVINNGNETIVVMSADGETIADVTPESNDYKIRIAGYEVTIGESARHRADRIRHNWFGHTNPLLEIGMSSLHNLDYSLYNTSDGDFMDLNIPRSIEVNFSPFNATLNLTRNHRLALLTSFQFVWHNYVFDSHTTLIKDNDGVLMPQIIDDSYRKSKITTFSMRVPLMLDLKLTHNFFISAGIWGGVTTKAYTKIKYPTEKHYNLPVNVFQYGFSARAGYGNFYIYADYNMTPLFKSDRGPAANTLDIGIGFGF